MAGLINHIKTQTTALGHAKAGLVGSVLAAGCGYYLGDWKLALTGVLIGGLGMGIAIELIQRLQRAGKAQNSIKESILDALMTAAWPLVFVYRYRG